MFNIHLGPSRGTGFAPLTRWARAQTGRRVAIIGQDGPVARNTPGVIAVHRDDPGLMLGYVQHSDETAAKFQGDWFMTGDIGQMDEQRTDPLSWAQ